MLQIAETVRAHGGEAETFTPIRFSRIEKRANPQEIKNHQYFGSWTENCIHYYLGSILGANGCFSFQGTKELLRYLDEFQPDIIHLHNLHEFCINLPMLFGYIKKNNIRVVWTLHDCWAFTGHCPYFGLVGCEKWKTECNHCPQPRVYPKMYLDTSKWMFHKKEKWFCGISNMTIVTPSQWLADLVAQSFLKKYPTKVINNGIDLSVFQPTQSNFREKYHIANDKFLLLGVAFDWGIRKGMDVFITLAKRLDQRYQIVLVGTNEMIDQQLPSNIISIHRTKNQKELAEIYTAADLFVNPTREENYPTVNMEAIACGTPVLAFRTGGSPEILDETCGAVVGCNDIENMEEEIHRICREKPYSEEQCLKKAQSFDMALKYEEYIRLYEDCTYSAESNL